MVLVSWHLTFFWEVINYFLCLLLVLLVSLSTTFSKQRLTVLYDGHYVMTLRKNILFQFHHYDFCFVVKTKNKILSMQDAQFDYRDYVWIILTVVSPLGLLSQGHEKKQFFSLQEDFDKIIILFHQLRGPRYDHENFFFSSRYCFLYAMINTKSFIFHFISNFAGYAMITEKEKFDFYCTTTSTMQRSWKNLRLTRYEKDKEKNSIFHFTTTFTTLWSYWKIPTIVYTNLLNKLQMSYYYKNMANFNYFIPQEFHQSHKIYFPFVEYLDKIHWNKVCV